MTKVIFVEKHGGPEVLTVRAEERKPLGGGQVRVRLRAIGVNRADILLREGRYHDRTLPVVPGFEAAGTVIESNGAIPVGTRVVVFERGQGLYREETIANEANVRAIPSTVPFETAAALVCTGLTALYTLRTQLRAQPRESVLVTAAGSGVGLTVVQVAKALGLNVIAAASSEAKRKAAREAGADETIDAAPDKLRELVLEKTSGGGVDTALDIVGGALFRPVLTSVRPFGRMVSMANVTGEDSLINVRDFYPRNISIHGFQLGALLAEGQWDPKPPLDLLMQMVTEGKLKANLHGTFTLSNVAAAHEELEKRTTIGKIVLLNEERE